MSAEVLDGVKAVRDAIAAKVMAAWTPAEIIFGKPRLPIDGGGIAAIRLADVPRAPLGTRTREETYHFEVLGRFRIPDDVILDDHKVEVARRLARELVADPHIGGGYRPHVSRILFEESDDPNVPLFEIVVLLVVSFEVFQ